ncbi:MAG: DUF2894 domain-containing protein [Bdellovibrionales bacterium]|nr:DUF2894 domain-containing protein [Massilia sp.]
MGDAAIPVLASPHTVPLSGIDALVASMKNEGGERFDAAGWHYLDTLAQRAAAHQGSVRRVLEAKLERALAAFAERFALARSAAAELLATTGTKHPQAAPELQRLFADGDFKGLRHLSATLEARVQCAALSELVSQLEPALTGTPGHPPAHYAISHTTTTGSPTLELKIVRESRATWARMSVDKQLALAMKQAPKNAGPINSHMLVLRSLAMMQEISPDYLSCMVSYVDTLLTLDPGEKDVPVKRKKAPPAKAAKPTKTARK